MSAISDLQLLRQAVVNYFESPEGAESLASANLRQVELNKESLQNFADLLAPVIRGDRPAEALGDACRALGAEASTLASMVENFASFAVDSGIGTRSEFDHLKDISALLRVDTPEAALPPLDRVHDPHQSEPGPDAVETVTDSNRANGSSVELLNEAQSVGNEGPANPEAALPPPDATQIPDYFSLSSKDSVGPATSESAPESGMDMKTDGDSRMLIAPDYFYPSDVDEENARGRQYSSSFEGTADTIPPAERVTDSTAASDSAPNLIRSESSDSRSSGSNVSCGNPSSDAEKTQSS